MTSNATTLPNTNLLRSYVGAGSIIVLALVGLVVGVQRGTDPAEPNLLIAPMAALFALVAVVWLVTLVVRNAAVILGKLPVEYFRDVRADAAVERLERPARAFNNLMQVPQYFYGVCLLMIAAGRADTAQVTLAWMFVALRAAHAVVFVVSNHVPSRFALFVASFLVLCTMWFRFTA